MFDDASKAGGEESMPPIGDMSFSAVTLTGSFWEELFVCNAQALGVSDRFPRRGDLSCKKDDPFRCTGGWICKGNEKFCLAG